jgi:hypothetical protein
VLLLLLVAACSERKEKSREILLPAVASVVIDSVDEKELAEGTRAAFGLKLPRDVKVTASFRDAVFAAGVMPLDSITNYVRDRVQAERVDTAPKKTVFQHAKVKSDPARRVRVEVWVSAPGKIQMVVRDETQKEPEPGLTQEERWRRAGMAPGGKPLDDRAE